ncbi:hypothetical protein X777_16052 [Ooceraea biroi]|uniref:Uncharacterized protein n=1 Tax=Ooceraea biroi TaxID=2015173 RepID=A0A026WUX4_OOCBI|nr:hypothetical protein X777_16052 [Ooceraea biroi]
MILLRRARQGSTDMAVPKNTRVASADGHGIPNDEIKSRYEFLEGTLPLVTQVSRITDSAR